MADTSIFIGRPQVVRVARAGEADRELVIERITFWHAQAWQDAWTAFARLEKRAITDPDRVLEAAVAIVHAGVPEPDPAHPEGCICRPNADAHALIDRASGEEFDAIFEAVCSVNRPKGTPDPTPPTPGPTPTTLRRSTRTKPWPAWLLRRRGPSTASSGSPSR